MAYRGTASAKAIRSVPGMFGQQQGSHCSWRGLSKGENSRNENSSQRMKEMGSVGHVESCRPS